MNWYFEVLRKYAVFRGRSRRSEYWYFALFNFIIARRSDRSSIAERTTKDLGTGLVDVIYVLAVLLPGLGVAIQAAA